MPGACTTECCNIRARLECVQCSCSPGRAPGLEYLRRTHPSHVDVREGLAEPGSVVPGLPVEAQPIRRVGHQGVDAGLGQEREKLNGVTEVERRPLVGEDGRGNFGQARGGRRCGVRHGGGSLLFGACPPSCATNSVTQQVRAIPTEPSPHSPSVDARRESVPAGRVRAPPRCLRFADFQCLISPSHDRQSTVSAKNCDRSLSPNSVTCPEIPHRFHGRSHGLEPEPNLGEDPLPPRNRADPADVGPPRRPWTAHHGR